MTEPTTEWIEEMGKLLKEYQRALSMRDQWERKRQELFQTIEVFRAGNAHNLTEAAQVPDTELKPSYDWQTAAAE